MTNQNQAQVAQNLDDNMAPKLDILLSKWKRRAGITALLALLPAVFGSLAPHFSTPSLATATTVSAGILGALFVIFAVTSYRSLARSWSQEFEKPLRRLLTTITLIEARELEMLPEERHTAFTGVFQKKLLEVARTILEHQRFVDQVVDNMFEMMFLLNPDGVILKANKAACETTGYSLDELVGQHFRKILPRGETLVDHFLEMEVQFTTSGDVRDLEVNVHTSEGELLPFSINGVKVETSTGALLGYTIIAKNMTEIFRLVAAINKSNFDLNKANAELEKRYEIIKQEVEVKEGERRLLEHELATSQLVQRMFLPQTAATHPNICAAGTSISATYCGGDWWNSITLDSRYYLFIGDVTGHGTPSAMVTAAVSGYYVSVRDALMAGRDIDVDAILDGFDAVLKAMGANDVSYNMTCFACAIDFPRRKIRFANAGHNFPLLCRNGRSETLVATGDRLGTRGNQPSEIVETDFEDGDLLVLFTDGLVENKNSEESQFGKRRLKKFIETHHASPVESFVKDLVKEATDFVGRTLDDDVTVVAARIQGNDTTLKKEKT